MMNEDERHTQRPFRLAQRLSSLKPPGGVRGHFREGLQMSKASTLAKGAIVAAAGAMALGAAASASAQPYGYYGDSYGGAYGGGGGYYDPCRRDSTNRGTVGALLGGALGASIGANAA